jgi:D-glycero-alpha-D-manno-heptose-7-phosphate kinase
MVDSTSRFRRLVRDGAAPPVVFTAHAPLRISLGGGGTDLVAYSARFGGYFVAAAIDRYVNVRVNGAPVAGWSRLPGRGRALAAVRRLGGDVTGLTFTSMSDLRPGSGLGSSGAFATALLQAVGRARDTECTRLALAERAYLLERDALTPSAGRQDTLVAALGGLREYEIDERGVRQRPLPVAPEVLDAIGRHFVLVDTGVRRPAERALAHQHVSVEAGDAAVIDNLHRTKALGRRSAAMLVAGDLAGYGMLMHEHWMIKRERSPHVTTAAIDELYEFGRRGGVSGGKLVGAGGGGFLLLHAPDPASVIRAYAGRGCLAFPVGISSRGAWTEPHDARP